MLSVGGRRILGIAVILAGVSLVLLATLRPDPFKESKTIVAEFEKVQGLGRIDRNVRIGGANAGSIGEVKRDGEKVLVELEIEPGISIHTDARANLRPHTIFEGSAFVDLHPGSPSAPELGESELIPSEQTSTYTSLDEATRVLNEPNRKKLQTLFESQRKLLRGAAIRGLRKTLKGAPKLFKDLTPTARALRGPEGDELAGAISGLAETADALASEEEDLLPLVQHANRTVAALRTDAGRPLDAALVALPSALEQFAAAREPLATLLARVNTLATELEPTAQQLGPLLRDSRPLLRRTTPIIRDSIPLVAGLRIVLARATDAAPALRRAVDALAPGSKVLVDSVLPALNAPGRNGLPVYAQLSMAFSGVSSVARAFQAPEHPSTNDGHVIRVGANINTAESLPGLLLPSCGTIALINPDLADQLEMEGLCNP